MNIKEVENAMFNSEKADKIINSQQPINIAIINRVKKNLSKKGISIDQSVEWDEYLIFTGKEAVVLSETLIVLHTHVSASGLFEELIHLGQMKSGRVIENNNENNILMEIEAKRRLIKYQKVYKITDYEIENIIESLHEYITMLNNLKKRGVENV